MTVALEPGAVIAGRYRLDRLIGEGGMGIVWAATHLGTGKPVALKHLREEASGDAETRKRFLREAQATAAIAHPNIVAVHDLVETEEGLPAIVMDLLDGEPLRAKLDRERKLPLEKAASILLPVVSAVGTAHAIGIVHRDLKPDNIFMARLPDGEARTLVLDFGIAKLTKTPTEPSAASVITGTWSLLGTPHYMSPEQIIGEKDIDHRTDIWALGAILYECLAGVRPAEAKTPGKIFELVLLRGIKPLSTLAPDLPRDVTDLVLRMLGREREDRPWDLHEVEAVLGRYTTEKAPQFGVPATIRLSNPGVLPPRIVARPVIDPPSDDPLTATAPDLRNIVASLNFDEPESSKQPSTLSSPEPPRAQSAQGRPSSEGTPSQRETLSAPETLPSPGAQERTPTIPPHPPVTTADARPLNPSADAGQKARPKPGRPRLPAAVIPILVALGAAGAGAGAWILLTPSAGDGPKKGAEQPAAGSSASAAAAGSGACPPDMVFIRGGAFLMGSNEGKEDERPVHRVEVRPFCLDRTEVTMRAYTACVVEGACSSAEATVTWSGISPEVRALESSFCLAYISDRVDHPINCIDWNQADKYCRARKKRLPAEDEWELAARGGSDQRRYPWGDAPPGPALANLCGSECREGMKKLGREIPGSGLGDDGFFQTAPVGHFAKGASKEGLVDMTGNVAEWTSSPHCPYPSHTCSNPARVFRGGGWMTFLAPGFTPTARLQSLPSHRFADVGFRCASPVK
ncbi:MAG TPA: SUMF1/EgtB/PvdO family nonheme iron enzyme [Polyangiaceae bacterium]|nr:SUMF1/EgtB/PvdO family nonheme iron enzyme [Polyangiaceae bacterium]